MTGSRSLVLYGTAGCHLCEVAESLLLPWVTQGVQVECVDVAESDALLARFGTLIPVLAKPEGNQLCWPFDENDLTAFLDPPGP